VFHFDRGLKLTRADLAIDVRRRQPRGFISHAHMDHMARHELAFCTPPTAALYHVRLGQRPVVELPYRAPFEWDGLRLTTYPAGHCLGSAMLLAEEGGTRLLYTGDFKLTPALTTEPAELPRADVLIIESTFGDPRYRWGDWEESVASLVGVVRDILSRGAVPVVLAYALGKAQEVTAILTRAGLAVQQERSVFAMSQVYAQFGVDLGRIELLGTAPLDGRTIVAPPQTHGHVPLLHGRRFETVAVTGWASDPVSRRRFRANHAVALSDHADFDELLRAIDLVQPHTVYCTHGPAEFVDHVRSTGRRAYYLDTPREWTGSGYAPAHVARPRAL
jgi:putative mRNA 3-end processing factor